MKTTTASARRWFALLIGLLALSMIGAAPLAAQPGPPACDDGYVLWANGRTGDNTLIISGSNTVITGSARSNADLRISGSDNRLTEPPVYTTLFQDGGDANTYPAPRQAPAAAPPVTYTIADYRPGGAIAEAARAAGRYRQISGDLDLAEPATLDGLYYVTGNAKLSAANLRGTVTIVAEGFIDVSGSEHQLSPYADGLLLLANRAEVGASIIKLAGGDSAYRGVISGLGGTVELSGSSTSVAGLILGDALTLAGSNLQLSFAGDYCPSGPGAPPESDPYLPGEVVVKLFSAGDLAAVAQANGLDPAPIGQFGTRPIYRLRITDGADPLVKAAQLAADGRVEYAEPNFVAQTPEARRGRTSWVIGQDAGGYAAQWAPGTIRLAQAHTVSRGAGITVAVLDTGIDPDHPALDGRLVAGYDFVNLDDDPREEGSREASPSFGHGTHVAGLVALVAPQAQIMPVRVLDTEGAGNIWVLTEGLLFAAERGPDGTRHSGDEADVINLSLSTTRSTRLLEDIVAELTCASADDDDDDDDTDNRCRTTGGVVVIAAAGNDGNTTPQYPAAEAVAGSLAVGASTRADTRAGFSTYGAWVRLAAPGEAIVSTVPGGGYGTWSGTSMAAPLTAGAAALVRATYPALRAPQVTERLVATGHGISGPISRRLDVAGALGIPLANSPACAGPCLVYLPLTIR